MRPYRSYQGAIVEALSNKLYVDPILTNMIRHHAGDGDDEETRRAYDGFLRFVTLQRIERDHVDVVLQLAGRRLGFQGVNLLTTSARTDQGVVRVSCASKLSEQLFWDGRSLKCENSVLPETIRSTMRGRPLGELVQHPYLPDDLPIASLTQGTSHWVAHFNAPKRQTA